MHPPPSPAWVIFSILMECTPESGRCHSAYSVVSHATVFLGWFLDGFHEWFTGWVPTKTHLFVWFSLLHNFVNGSWVAPWLTSVNCLLPTVFLVS
jgi:hypothetical protein